MKKPKKTVFATPWPYTFAMATVDTVELAAWTLLLHIRLAASMQPPDLLRANGWWQRPPRVTVTCTPIANMETVAAFFSMWPQHQSQGELLHWLAIDVTRSTPVLQCLALQWDRTDDEIRILCGSITVEPEHARDD
jgi:hypothetical protein